MTDVPFVHRNVFVFLYYFLLTAHFFKDELLVTAQFFSVLLKILFSKVVFVFLVVMFAFSLKNCFVEESREPLLEKEGCLQSLAKNQHARVS